MLTVLRSSRLFLVSMEWSRLVVHGEDTNLCVTSRIDAAFTFKDR